MGDPNRFVIPSPSAPDEPVVDTSGAAAKEAAAFANGTLEEEAKKSEHGRNEKLRDHIHRAFVIGVWSVFILFGISSLALIWHVLMPEKWGWLDASQLSTIKTAVLSSVVSQGVGGYMTKRLK